MVTRGLHTGFLLDQQWHVLRGEMETSKRPALIALAQVLADTATSYAIIDGVALQVHQEEPRTTLDIDLAVQDLDAIPRAELQAAGFRLIGRFAHSENWVGPEGVPVQFTDDPALTPALQRALEIEVHGVRLHITAPIMIIHGEEDSMAPFAVSKRIATSNPHVRLVALHNTDHGFVGVGDDEGTSNASEANKQLIYELVSTFLQKEG